MSGGGSPATEGAMDQSRGSRRAKSVTSARATTTPHGRSRSLSSGSLSDGRRKSKDGRGVDVPDVPAIPRCYLLSRDDNPAAKNKNNDEHIPHTPLMHHHHHHRHHQPLHSDPTSGGRLLPLPPLPLARQQQQQQQQQQQEEEEDTGTDDFEVSSPHTSERGSGRDVRARERKEQGHSFSSSTRTPVHRHRACQSEYRIANTSPLSFTSHNHHHNYEHYKHDNNSNIMSRAPYNPKRRSMPLQTFSKSEITTPNISARPQSRLEHLRASAFGSDDYASSLIEQPRATFTRASLYDDTSSQYSRTRSALYDRPSHSLRDRVNITDRSQRRRGASLGEPSRRSHGTAQHLSSTLEAQHDAPAAESQSSDSSDDFHDTSAEVHELKYRITRMESHERNPTTSSTAASGESSDRPRTATTAPTTVDMSPKQRRKHSTQSDNKRTITSPLPETAADDNTTAVIHPLLHDALARLKDSTQSNVYRAMEAVVSDAIHLASSTNPSGAQSNAYSGATLNDRHVKRKADNLCRNLTDLCLVLSDLKQDHSPSAIVSQPAQMTSSAPISPLRRLSRNNSLTVTSPQQQSRPMSRLEQRKASLLGEQPYTSFQSISPRASFGEMSSEAESTPTHSNSTRQPPRRVNEAPTTTYLQRPPSRAATDVGTGRSRSRFLGENNVRRTPSLRDSLTSRRQSVYNTPPSIKEEENHPHHPRPGQAISAERPVSTLPRSGPSIFKRRHALE